MTRLAVALLTAVLLPSLAGAVSDPTQPGRFAAGVMNLTFTTNSLVDGAPRVLNTVIWYPAVQGTGTDTTLGVRDAAVHRGRFPLLVFSHGSCGIPEQSVFFTKQLATWGYVVAAPPHPGNEAIDGFPGCFAASGRSLQDRPHDVSVAIDGMLAAARDHASPFAHRISPRRIGISGHSLGGLTTVLVAQHEPRVRAALAFAPALVNLAGSAPIGIPFMTQAGEVDSLAPLSQSQAAYALAAPPRFLLEILKVGHFAWSDICAAVLFGIHDCDPGTLTQAEAHTLVLRFAVPFLERYLRGHVGFARLITPASAPAGVVLTAEPRP